MTSKKPPTVKRDSVSPAVTGFVLQQMSGGPLGNLRDFHMKWMLEFTKWVFDSAQSNMTLDVKKQRIYLIPADAEGKPLTPKTYAAILKAKKVNKLTGRIPGYLGLDLNVEFRRVVPKGAVNV